MPSPLQLIGPEKSSLCHDPFGRYLYRGYAILGVDDGWEVRTVDIDTYQPRYDDFSEIGWGNSMYEAMAVVNEAIEGSTRRKSK